MGSETLAKCVIPLGMTRKVREKGAEGEARGEKAGRQEAGEFPQPHVAREGWGGDTSRRKTKTPLRQLQWQVPGFSVSGRDPSMLPYYHHRTQTSRESQKHSAVIIVLFLSSTISHFHCFFLQCWGQNSGPLHRVAPLALFVLHSETQSH